MEKSTESFMLVWVALGISSEKGEIVNLIVSVCTLTVGVSMEERVMIGQNFIGLFTVIRIFHANTYLLISS